MLKILHINKNIYNFYILNIIKKKIKYYYNHFIYYGCSKWYDKKDFLYKDKVMFSYIPKIFKPSGYWYRMQHNFYILKIYFSNSWKFYRHFFGYTVFGNTRTNSNSIKLASKKIKNVLNLYVYKKKFKLYQGKDKQLVIHIETLNKLWYFQWRGEWRKAWIKFYDYLTTSRKKFKFGVYFCKKNKGLNFIPRPQKKNKKKIVIPQDNFNIGFYFSFTKYFRKQIMAGKAVK